MASIYLYYVVCKDKHEAKEIALSLLNQNLIKCANYFSINSLYLWENKLHDDNEIILLLKTSHSDLFVKIQQLHSYKIPCILRFNPESNSLFFNWLNSKN